MPDQPHSSPSDCGCGPDWRKPKPNGTCATCGGWLPGERPQPLPWLRDDIKKAGEQIKRHEAGLQESSRVWVCQPWFDEGDDWPEEPGTPHLIHAPTREAAFEKARVECEREYTSLAGIQTMTPEEWFSQGGYPLEGLPRP